MTDPALVITVFLSFLLFFIQRSEARARRIVLTLVVLMFLVIRQFAIDHGDEGMAWRALLIAAALNFVFWFLVGRYNTPKSSDEITVIGMDD